MKLNTDIISHFKKNKKTVYPTKRTMNLYFKMDRTTAPATIALYSLFALVVVFALSKVMIYDPLQEAKQLENRISALETQAVSKLEQLKEYDTILEKYVRATPTEEQVSEVDRIKVLDLIDTIIRPSAQVAKVDIADGKVLLTFYGVTLEQAGDLVARLDASKMVTNMSVDTAISKKDGRSLVETNVYFEVVREEEVRS